MASANVTDSVGPARAIIYAAKSTEDRRGSIGTQLDDCRRMAAREGWEVVGEYSDEAASAWSGDRGPQLAAAMEHAERIAPSVLVAAHSDRLARGDGRRARHLAELYFWALKADVQVRSVEDDSTFSNPILAVALGERNAEDSRRKSLAVAAGMKRRAERGKPNGGPRPYGYRYAADGLIAVAAEAEVVRRVFAEFIAGRSITAIARWLHRDKIPTLRGGPWRQSTVSGILRNRRYVGQIENNGEAFDGHHEPIITAAVFERAQQVLAARPERRGGRPPKGRHLFRGGMLRCECGEAMVPRTRDGYELYYCNGAAKFGHEHCRAPATRRAVIDGAVYRYFERVGLDVEATRAQLAGDRERRLAQVRARRLEAERDTLRVEGELARIKRDYRAGKLPAEDWLGFRDELGAELVAARGEAERLAGSEADIERDGEQRDAEQETLNMLADIREAIIGELRDAQDVDAVRAALSSLFDGFVLHPQRGARYEGRGRSELVDIDPAYMIELRVRPSALEGYTDDGWYPMLRREPLYQAKNNQRDGLPIR